MKRFLISIAVATATATALALPASAATSGTGTWQTVPLPSTVAQIPALSDVSAAGPDAAWAVGTEGQQNTLPGTPLILHWDGTSWAKDAVPVSFPGGLSSVAAASATDAWASGGFAPSVVLHWDGTAWSSVPFPGDQQSSTSADVVTAIATNQAGDAWLVGYNKDPSTNTIVGGIAEQWTGTSWVTVTPPAGIARLDGVQVTAAGDAWAAGTGTDGKGVVIHRNGSSWQTLADVPGAVSLDTVFAASNRNVWAGGATFIQSTNTPFLEHWNGHKWDSPTAQPTGFPGAVTSISADAKGQPQWAGIGAAAGTTEFFEFFNGKTWTLVQVTVPSSTDAQQVALDVAHIPGTNATWAVGTTTVGNNVPDSAFIQINNG